MEHSTLIKGDVPEGMAALKQQSGKDIFVFGSADLVNTLTQHDLIDEYRLMVFPVIVGKGKRLFEEGLDTKAMRLVGTTIFDPGTIVLTYGPAAKESE